MEERIKQLRTRVEELLKWKQEYLNQQVKFPLDFTSKNLVQKNLLITTGNYTSSITADLWLEVVINEKVYWLACTEV